MRLRLPLLPVWPWAAASEGAAVSFHRAATELPIDQEHSYQPHPRSACYHHSRMEMILRLQCSHSWWHIDQMEKNTERVVKLCLQV